MTTTALTERLAKLATAINHEHQLCEAGYRTAVEHAQTVGHLLIEAKAQLSHGDWLPWVGEHTPIDPRTAQRYMQLAGLPNASSATHLHIEDALHAIAKPAARPDDLRTALRAVDHADAEAALAELGETPPPSVFPDSGMERETWRQIHESVKRFGRAMDEASAAGLSKWSRREALQEAARHLRHGASQLSELSDTLAS